MKNTSKKYKYAFFALNPEKFTHIRFTQTMSVTNIRYAAQPDSLIMQTLARTVEEMLLKFLITLQVAHCRFLKLYKCISIFSNFQFSFVQSPG